MAEKTGIVICSYNMPEYTDKLVEHIVNYVNRPYALVVFDNGSDLVPPSRHTTHKIDKNSQMIPGFMQGLQFVADCDFYWLITTSCSFDPEDSRDPLEVLLPALEDNPQALGIQAGLEIDYGSWKEYLRPRGAGIREVFALECVAPLYRAKNFNQLGRWNQALLYGWGFDMELHWKARKNNMPIYTHDGYKMFKETFVGYHMDRMNMTGVERSELAWQQCEDILGDLYGKDWAQRLHSEFRSKTMDNSM